MTRGATFEVQTIVWKTHQSQPDSGKGPSNHLFVPDSAHPQVLQWGHFSKLTCDPGYNRALAFLHQCFWWPTMAQDTRELIIACSICTRGKPSYLNPAGLLYPLPIPSQSWLCITVDFVSGVPPSEGNTVTATIVKVHSFHPLSQAAYSYRDCITF